MFLEGVAFIESHTLETNGDDTNKTIHILVKRDFAFYELSLFHVNAMFETAVAEILYKNKQVVRSANLDVQEVSDDSVIEYGFKHVWEKNLSNVRTLSLLDLIPS